MNKRLSAAIAAGVLAILGIVVLVTWAKGANDRAYDGADLVKVVQVTVEVASGTKASDLPASTKTIKLPSAAVPDGAVTMLSQVDGLTTNASLEPGEVLLKSRLALPGSNGSGKTVVPKGYQEISVSLDAARTIGGELQADDHVGVIVSIDETKETSLVRHFVLVTKVDHGPDGAAAAAAMVTLAVKSEDAEKIVYGMEYGKVWLTKQNVDTDRTGEKIIDAQEVLK